ncbi:metalloregulator ArsR/SmtB family transcription factor [Alteromonas ponticola]|uniref:Metalloregulator ArsR/SmtB family transcription factor n=1 Tax=Alteromonas aquimaris TaxID=2998417 RepID=A0ABT3P651_9ALTE|nr:metalloregulator ArsR/SmtB family transcription factor [Alteromonas aquimaris]MCW8108243.1 metalloregulator ArsR/SmtB family transcription factor [Alteromonas aquimaris]
MELDNTIDTREMLDNASSAERFIKQFANKTRLMVMCSLLENELSVSELLTRIPVTQPVLSQHLALLREAKMVATRRDGQVIYYSLKDSRIEQTIALLYSFFCEQKEVA